MLKKIALCALSVATASAWGQSVPAITPGAAPAADVSYEANASAVVVLNPKEREALRIARKWRDSPDKPVHAANGSVKYLFGATLPTLVCTPLQVCMIRFEPGEIVGEPQTGDQIRWFIKRAEVGDGNSITTLAIVKPTEAGLKTNVIFATNKRVYNIALKSAKHEWMPELSFDYPEDQNKAWSDFRSKQERVVNATTLPTGENIAGLDFGFSIGGDSPKWKPTRVYSGNGKTYIQFDPAGLSGDAPALVVIGAGKSLWSSSQEQMVNYRLVGDRYVVDQVIDKAALISGVGSGQTKVTIEYVGGKGK
ncbi:MAG: P-type conjugative transfer protein TrbG [Devosia sp.]